MVKYHRGILAAGLAAVMSAALPAAAFAEATPSAAASSSADDQRTMDDVDALMAQGEDLFGQGRYKDAIVPAEKALALSEAAFGDGPYTAVVLDSLGLIYASDGQYDKAEAAYRRALGMAEYAESVGVDLRHREISLCTKLGLLYRYTDRLAEAEPWLIRALAVSDLANGADSDVSIDIAGKLAELYEAMGRPADAAPLRARAKARGNPPSGM